MSRCKNIEFAQKGKSCLLFSCISNLHFHCALLFINSFRIDSVSQCRQTTLIVWHLTVKVYFLFTAGQCRLSGKRGVGWGVWSLTPTMMQGLGPLPVAVVSSKSSDPSPLPPSSMPGHGEVRGKVVRGKIYFPRLEVMMPFPHTHSIVQTQEHCHS